VFCPADLGRLGPVRIRAVQSRGAAAAVIVIAAALALTDCSHAKKAPTIKSTVRPGVAPVPPSQGAYFGARVEQRQGTARFEKGLGREMDIVSAYRSWDQPFPGQSDLAALGADRFLMLSWDGGDIRAILSGSQDTVIRQRARAVKAIGKPLFLRWRREMDRREIRKEIGSPADYVAAWKHIREIFRQEKADNAAWIWCPSAKGFVSSSAAAYYPGDDQVDWLCADVYPEPPGEYVELAQLVTPFLDWARVRPKPIMIGQFGVPRAYGSRRAEWLRKAAQTLQDPRIKAVVYDNDDVVAQGVRTRYSLDGDQPAMSAMRELATTPHFNPRNLPVSSG
jgi:hypothetical protein